MHKFDKPQETIFFVLRKYDHLLHTNILCVLMLLWGNGIVVLS